MINLRILKILYLFIFTILGVFLIYSHIQKENIGPSIIESAYNKNNLIDFSDKSLTEGNKLIGKFYSKYNNLGTILFRFNTQNRINNDIVEFQIKEEGSENWYYQNKYNTDQFQSGELFPFGFPIITNSKNKTYIFEMELLSKSNKDSVVVDTKYPTIFSVKYQFPISKMKPLDLVSYFFIKIKNLFGNKNFIFHFFAYFSPILFFITLKFIKGVKSFLLLLLATIFFDSFFIPSQHSDFYTSVIFMFWLYYFYKNKLKPEVTIAVAIFLLIINGSLMDGLNNLLAERISIWTYLLFINIILQKIIFSYKKQNPSVGLKEILYLPILKIIKLTKEFLNNKNIHFLFWGKRISGVQLRMGTSIAFKIFSIIFLIYIFYKNIRFTILQIKLYELFFPQSWAKTFLSDIGIYLIIVYILSIVIFIFTVNHFKSLSLKLILFILFSLFIFKINNYLINNSTSKFRSNIIINSVTPKKATLWDEVIIRGYNFKELPFGGRVLIDNQAQRVIYWSNNKIIFTTDPSKTKTGKLKIIDYKNVESDGVDFEYYDFDTKKIIY